VPVRPREDIEGIMELTKEELPPEVRVLRGVPGRHFGKYILLEELGRGGTGMVQKAWDTIMGEYVALKFIKEAAGTKTGDTSSFRKRQDQVLALLQEARAAARLYHPNILPIRDLGLVGGTVYLSMDYIEGTTLHQAIKSAQDRKRLSCLYEDPVFHMGIVRSVAEALHYAHTSARPLVHCDLKPSNILVSVAGTPYVMDFGLARLLDLPAEYEAVARGTPSYMAPEQIVGKDLSVRTDVYGLGTILYELVCGRPPFVGRDAEDIAMKTMYDAPKRPTEAFRLDDESRRGPTMAILEMVTLIESVCLRCMAKDPAMRYGTALEVADEIETVLEVLESRDLSRQLGLDRR
jgi:serine/threonine-protein kinase